jgi:manganese transport protein
VDKPANPVIKWMQAIGPGLVTAALVFGPSKLTITSKLGALYGYDLLWIVTVAIFFMAVFTTMSTRIGATTNISILQTVRQKWGKPASVLLGVGVFLVSTSFQAGNSIGVGIALGELSGTSPTPWVIGCTVSAVSLLFFRKFYAILEKTMIALILLMLFSFITTFVLAKPDFTSIVKGFTWPSLPEGSLGLVIAFTASCFSIVGALYQSYLIQERIRLNPSLKNAKNDSLTGTLLLGVMSAVVIVCAAAVLNPKGLTVNTGSDMAKALEPIFGHNAATIFLVGLFGAAFSSQIGNASVGGTLLSDALGYGSSFGSKSVRIATALVMIVGASVALIFGKLPLELIVFAQSVTIFVVPFIGIAMFIIANDKNVMGDKINTSSTKIFAVAGLALIIVLALINVNELFLK